MSHANKALTVNAFAFYFVDQGNGNGVVRVLEFDDPYLWDLPVRLLLHF
jgi:hypothetical protein